MSEAPKKFGRYEVEALIGDGAMGRVYRARDPLARRTVAVKTVRSELLTQEDAAEYLRRFQREAQAAGPLAHPNIVVIFDVGPDYIVMEYLDGTTLQARLQESGRLDPTEALAILRPVAAALDHAHANGVVHRDIKPANIMILPDGQPKIMDFGIAHLDSTIMTKAGQTLGSPSYMAPEQIAGETVSPRTDLFALAVIAYEMLTGKRAFDGKNITTVINQVLNHQPELPCKLNEALPAHYDEVFSRALAKDPKDRYESAGAFAAALDLKHLDATLSAAIEALVTPTEGPSASSSDDSTVQLARPRLQMESTRPDAEPAPAAAQAASGVPAVGLKHKVWLPLLLLVVLIGILGTAGFGVYYVVTRVRAALPTPAAVATLPSPSSSVTPEVPAPAPKRVLPSPKPRSTARPPATPVRTPPPTPAPRKAPRPVQEGDLVALTKDVKPPAKISGPTPEYPKEARKKKLQGTVTLEMIVTEKGEPIELKVTESVGEALDQAVLEAVRKWRFAPATKDGTKVRVRWQTRHTFILK